jgi:uncharacterized protein YjbI with pentapeptide repeats
LYNSRFINADLNSCDFINCNLQQVYFAGAQQEGLNFKSSNTAEALFEIGEE